MPRVLIYAPTVGRGGVHRVVRTLMHALSQVAGEDWTFAVLGQTFDEIGKRIEWPSDWPFTQIDPGPDIPAHPRQFEWLFQQREVFVEHLMRVAGAYDLVYCPSPWWTMRSEDWSLPVPFVTTVPDFAFDMIDMGLLAYNFRYVAKQVAARADHIIFPSDFQRQWGETYYGMKHTHTIHHSADFVADHFEPTGDEAVRVIQKYDLPKRYILAFHPMYHKGINVVIPAMQGVHIPLVVAGIGTEHILSDAPIDQHIETVRGLLAQSQLETGKTFFALGQVPEEDIAGLYVGAMCAVCASFSDGDLSGSMFEAMMATCPLIFSNLPVFTERLGTDDRYGLSFPVGDVNALRRCILNASNSPQACRHRAMEAFAYAHSRTAQDVARDYLKVFEEALKCSHDGDIGGEDLSTPPG